jgi:hypothetical protein
MIRRKSELKGTSARQRHTITSLLIYSTINCIYPSLWHRHVLDQASRGHFYTCLPEPSRPGGSDLGSHLGLNQGLHSRCRRCRWENLWRPVIHILIHPNRLQQGTMPVNACLEGGYVNEATHDARRYSPTAGSTTKFLKPRKKHILSFGGPGSPTA